MQKYWSTSHRKIKLKIKKASNQSLEEPLGKTICFYGRLLAKSNNLCAKWELAIILRKF